LPQDVLTTGLAIVAATKIAFVGWGIGIRSLDFTGISGHAMRATAVIPVIFYLMLSRSHRVGQLCGIALGVLSGVFLGISRVEVSAHSVSEAAAGSLLGLIVSAGFIWKSFAIPNPAPKMWLIVFSLIALFPTLYAKPAPTHHWINEIALYLSGRDKPYGRENWKNNYLESSLFITPSYGHGIYTSGTRR
jgi:hypothetical protein